MAADKKPLRNLSVYLLRSGLVDPEAAVNDKGCKPPILLQIDGAESAVLIVRKTPPRPPKWAKLFEEAVGHLPNDLAAPAIAGVLFIVVDGRGFALTFGAGGRHLLRDDVWEERFGLLTALKAVDPMSLRSVDVQSLDALQSQARIQSGQEASAEEFGLNVEQDLLKAIVGSPINGALGTRMAGSDCLNVSVRAILSDLPPLLIAYLAKYEEPLTPGVHDWVTNIAPVKSSGVIASLELQLEARVGVGNLDGLWLAIPEIIDWSKVKGFVFSGDRKTIYPDISFQGFKQSLKGKPPTLRLMKDRSAFAVDDEGEVIGHPWKVYKCLYAEIDHAGAKHILNDGKWYLVAEGFAQKTQSDYSHIPLSSLVLPPYKGGGEGVYNVQARDSAPARFFLFDADPIMHGGGQGKVEVCDLLSVDGELIHIKQYSKSSVLSHLFAQGFVSAQLIHTDDEFRAKVISKVAAPFASKFDPHTPPSHGTFKVVYGIISDAPGPDLRLPFFSQVNLNNTVRVLRGHGFKVELLKINWDESLVPKAAHKKSKKALHLA